MDQSKIIALIPAHNEENTIRQTIESIYNQSIIPDKVIIICDNCTDNTDLIARQIKKKYEGLSIFYTTNNKSKKAGALNQAISRINHTDYVLCMDADTVLDKELIKHAIDSLDNNPELGAVCSRAGIIKSGNTLWEKFLWSIQHLEYGQFDSSRVETHNNIKVAHGMCTVYKYEALRQVMDYRRNKQGLDKDCVYLENNLVEDYELTLCLKELGWKICTNLSMLAWTDVPLSVRGLWVQRCRWLRGGVDCLRLHGLNRATYWDIFNHVIFAVLLLVQVYMLYCIVNTVLSGVFVNRKIPQIIIENSPTFRKKNINYCSLNHSWVSFKR